MQVSDRQCNYAYCSFVKRFVFNSVFKLKVTLLIYYFITDHPKI